MGGEAAQFLVYYKITFKKKECDQKHLLECEALIENNQLVKETPKYSDIFEEDIEKIIHTAKIIQENFKKKKEMEDNNLP